jgi:hypothetical protein
VAKEHDPDTMAARTFWITFIGAILFIGVAFLFITLRTY